MGISWDAVASYNFRKPLVWTNLLPIADPIAYSNKFIFSPKLYFSNKENRYLPLREIKGLRLSFKNHLNDFSQLNISLVENTLVEIMDMTKEMIEVLNNKAVYTSEDKSRQEKLLKLYKELFSYK